ncbi:hypothetical protein [Pseudomonas sp. KNUC1026]|uniref:hypothetical protein n=1 Tax=Pseudomonas sp. KNUC1026 TaxID=2893890 RepID=UPI001F29E727|nr:hypothetical protein [Pseudomonas sp. KNUC1026]UFH48275.1 hypothetical protein LN139_13985 [Pseudomonas sp. KNUC1026]
MTRQHRNDFDIDEVPTVDAALEPIEGDQRCLMPVAALQAPVKVSFKRWWSTPGPPGDSDQIWLYRQSNIEVGHKTFANPVDVADAFMMVDMGTWPDGDQQLYYRLEQYNGDTGRSRMLPLWIDRKAPLDGNALVLPPELGSPATLTARYLEANDDRLPAAVRGVTGLLPGDTLYTYLSAQLMRHASGALPPLRISSPSVC